MEKEEQQFECSICLDAVREPVVTLCGHLFCWPCIYQWTHTIPASSTPTHCPVCKAQVSLATLVPIYGRGYTPNKTSHHHHHHTPTPPHPPGSVIPRRPSGPRRFGLDHPNQPYTYSMPDPVTGVLCEMVYRRLFGDSLTGPPSPRLSRRAMQADESLSRVFFFLLCCMIMCLLLF